jgi:hypothetical protein
MHKAAVGNQVQLVCVCDKCVCERERERNCTHRYR